MCIFCKIVNKEIPNNTVHESEHFLAFHDLYPKAPIHILIIPKTHVDCFQDVTPETMAGLSSFTQEVASKVGIDESGYRLITNNGPDGGQEIFHLHFHLFTRLGQKAQFHPVPGEAGPGLPVEQSLHQFFVLGNDHVAEGFVQQFISGKPCHGTQLGIRINEFGILEDPDPVIAVLHQRPVLFLAFQKIVPGFLKGCYRIT